MAFINKLIYDEATFYLIREQSGVIWICSLNEKNINEYSDADER